MPTILSHPAVPLAIGLGLGNRFVSRHLLAAGVLASVLPDADVMAFRWHIAYADDLGHRGFTHSLAFAIALGGLAWLMSPRLGSKPPWAFGFVAASAASHGLLDMCTNGGHGVAWWWPLSSERLFAPWRFIEAAPLSLGRFLGPQGWVVLQSELLWIWLPALVLCGLLAWWRSLAWRQ